MTVRVHVNAVMDIDSIDQKFWDKVLTGNAEAHRQLERMRFPDLNHNCEHCPVDGHTVRMMLRELCGMRDQALDRLNNTTCTDFEHIMIRALTVNVMDGVLAQVCALFDPEKGVQLKERYPE